MKLKWIQWSKRAQWIWDKCWRKQCCKRKSTREIISVKIILQKTSGKWFREWNFYGTSLKESLHVVNRKSKSLQEDLWALLDIQNELEEIQGN